MTLSFPGLDLITKERLRQIIEEGYSAEHDDGHDGQELAWAAVCYAAPENVYIRGGNYLSYTFSAPYPWGMGRSARMPEIERLTKAGALIAAEIDRLLRLDKTSVESVD
jgi:hypothetical protein